jgi:flagellar protein FlgJ
MKITSDFSSQISGAEKQKDSKLVDAAQQFEAMLMQEMLKPMRAGQNDWSGEKSDDSAADTISTFGSEAVAKAISKGGGLGIASQVVRQVTREHEKDSENKTVGY